MPSFEKVVIVGLGYVGLPAALMLARSGRTVIGVDIDPRAVDAVNAADTTLHEEEMRSLIKTEAVRQNLRAQGVPCEADVFIIAVPTPIVRRKRIADLSFVEAAMASIISHLRPGNLVIVESTIPPLTCRGVISPMIAAAGFRAGEDVLLAHCPERVFPGNVLHEIVHNDRVIGGVNERSADAAASVYASFVKGRLFKTDDVTAELCKLMENSYRDVNIALANEFQAVGEGLGIDIRRAIELANNHPRVHILMPGIGVGGHCIPIDPWFIKEVDPDNSTLISAARAVNDRMPARTAARIRRIVSDIAEPRIIALGASYKPNSSDIRESPSLEIVRILKDEGYDIALYDPLVRDFAYGSLTDIVRGADCVVVLVAHAAIERELRASEDALKSLMRTPRIVRF